MLIAYQSELSVEQIAASCKPIYDLASNYASRAQECEAQYIEEIEYEGACSRYSPRTQINELMLLTETEDSVLLEERVPCTPKQAMLLPIDLSVESQQSSDSLRESGFCGRLISTQSFGLAEPIRFLIKRQTYKSRMTDKVNRSSLRIAALSRATSRTERFRP